MSYQQSKLYFTYNGGPVFNLTVNPNQRVTSSSADLSQPLPPSGNPSQDAAQYARRAHAFLARNQFDLASAEFERAMQLVPTDPEYAYEAGTARVLDQQPEKALVDLDAAISYSKEDVLAVRIALDYVDVGQYRTAVEMLSAWISKNPKHKSIPAAFSNRCYARAAEGQQLDLALSDCEVALAGMPMNYIALTRRGLVYLRRSQTDRALSDFNEALKQELSYAIALYGKGILESRRGRTKDADADFKAAAESLPEVSETFAVMGLESH